MKIKIKERKEEVCGVDMGSVSLKTREHNSLDFFLFSVE